MELSKSGTKKRDRVLGDQWKTWKARPDDFQTINEKKRTFFIFSFFLVVSFVLGVTLFLYLISPRLGEISSLLLRATVVLFIATIVMASIWYVSLVLAVLGKRSISFSRGLNKKLLLFIIDKTTKLGARFGVSRDRMANSFLKVLNIVTEQDTKRSLPLKPLVVLPRCLTREIKEKAGLLSKKYGLEYFIVGGGEAALAAVRDKNPDAIIGVACERDLLSGIKDVTSNVPVIAISNKRPHGPCKETDIDVNELEKAIRYFLQV